MPKSEEKKGRGWKGYRPSRELIVLWLVGLLVIGGYTAVEWMLLDGSSELAGLGLPLDDSWIHLQFARNLRLGDGLTYNPGEAVTGTTAPLWTALLSLLYWLPGSTGTDAGSVTLALVAAKLLGVGLYLASIAVLLRLARRLGMGAGAALLSAGLFLATPWMVWSALSAMEIPLFVLLSLLGVDRHLRERAEPELPTRALPLFALAALARPEGLLLLLLAVVDRLLVWRLDQGPGAPEEVPEAEASLALHAPPWRKVLTGAALAGLILLPVGLWFWHLSGSPLPTTFGAKTLAGRGWSLDAGYLYTVLGIFLRPQPIVTLLAGGGALVLLRRLGSRDGGQDVGLLPVLWPLCLPLAYSLLSPAGGAPLVGNFGRYFFPLFPFVILLGVLALESVADRLRSLQIGRWHLPLRGVLLALVLLPTVSNLVQGAGRYAQNVANVQDSNVRLGLWVREHLPPEAVVAVPDIGAVKYLAPNRVVDLWGLIHPELQHDLRAAVSERDPAGEAGMRRFLARHRPDFLVAYPRWYPQIQQDRTLLRPILELTIPGNITMTQDRMTVYVTAWNDVRAGVAEP